MKGEFTTRQEEYPIFTSRVFFSLFFSFMNTIIVSCTAHATCRIRYVITRPGGVIASTSRLDIKTLFKAQHQYSISRKNINHSPAQSYMRIPSFPTLIRTFYTISNATTSRFFARSPASQKALAPFTRGTVLQSMPTLPFLGSLFSSSAKDMTEYPVRKSDDEWRAVLNPGI